MKVKSTIYSLIAVSTLALTLGCSAPKRPLNSGTNPLNRTLGNTNTNNGANNTPDGSAGTCDIARSVQLVQYGPIQSSVLVNQRVNWLVVAPQCQNVLRLTLPDGSSPTFQLQAGFSTSYSAPATNMVQSVFVNGIRIQSEPFSVVNPQPGAPSVLVTTRSCALSMLTSGFQNGRITLPRGETQSTLQFRVTGPTAGVPVRFVEAMNTNIPTSIIRPGPGSPFAAPALSHDFSLPVSYFDASLSRNAIFAIVEENGEQVSCDLPIDVAIVPRGPAPSCRLRASPATVTSGQTDVTLTLENTSASDASSITSAAIDGRAIQFPSESSVVILKPTAGRTGIRAVIRNLDGEGSCETLFATRPGLSFGPVVRTEFDIPQGGGEADYYPNYLNTNPNAVAVGYGATSVFRKHFSEYAVVSAQIADPNDTWVDYDCRARGPNVISVGRFRCARLKADFELFDVREDARWNWGFSAGGRCQPNRVMVGQGHFQQGNVWPTFIFCANVRYKN